MVSNSVSDIHNFADPVLNCLPSILEEKFITDYSKSRNLANRVTYIIT